MNHAPYINFRNRINKPRTTFPIECCPEFRPNEWPENRTYSIESPPREYKYGIGDLSFWKWILFAATFPLSIVLR